MDTEARKFLFDLLHTASPSGFEEEGQRKWAEYIGPHVDEVSRDSYGTTWATLKGTEGNGGPTVMLEAHADEIGFMAKHITDDGFIHLTSIGGTDRATARGKRLFFHGSKGPVAGVIGNTAIHIRNTKDEKTPEWHELYVDIGEKSRAGVMGRGIRVGTPAVYAESVEEIAPGKLIGRALDNRIGGFILTQVMLRLARQKKRPRATVYAVNAVQEELGGHGAKMIAYRLHPSVAIVLDVTHATDTPGIDKTKHGSITLGGGPTVTHGTANHPKVVERLLEAAAKEEIPIQHEASSRQTGTDTDDIYTARTGVPSALVSIPMRYMHSTVEMIDLEDVERCIRVLKTFVLAVRNAEAF